LRPPGYTQQIAKGNLLPPELPLAIPGAASELPRKGLEGCEAATARSAGAGAIAESRKARFLARSAKDAPFLEKVNEGNPTVCYYNFFVFDLYLETLQGISKNFPIAAFLRA
jgi:hypothetical protein